ncbi:hypothetical protein [Mycolicibacterium tokaiense]|uniref:hypothetical protein n=1 Tax=Mycolicibacterium tokaiense TaxID=39695 RepID=UPI000E1C0811|nr:hypothetical protein [Mycolicibacterium tokaiense]BBY85146.1 hypothetical protein MTOK_09280 [Mycolicibacterium tokaiense]
MSIDTRFAFEMASEYFLDQLERHPATPPDLANSFRKLADGYTEMLFLQLARARQVELEEVYRTTDALDAEIDKTYS